MRIGCQAANQPNQAQSLPAQSPFHPQQKAHVASKLMSLHSTAHGTWQAHDDVRKQHSRGYAKHRRKTSCALKESYGKAGTLPKQTENHQQPWPEKKSCGQ